MTRRTLHRKDIELRGKALSANTIASFLAAQGIRSVADLDTGRPMSPELLLFLNRDRAVGYWLDQGWLSSDGSALYLTATGLDEVQSREAGEALKANGDKKGGNVSPALVAQALRFILDGAGEDVPAVSRSFDVPEAPR